MLAIPAMAQSASGRPVRIVVGFAAGAGVTDGLARLYGEKLSDLLKAPVIVENKPGAGQIAAVRLLQQAQPDGNTLWMATGSALAQGPAFRTDLPYRPLKDFTFLNMVATTPAVLVVHPDTPVKSVRELIAYAASNPGKLTYGSAGVGSSNHLHIELLMNRTGVKMTHVPYKNDADMIRDVIAGTVQVALSTGQTTIPHVAAGKVRALAVTSQQRLAALPGVPAADEIDVKGFKEIVPYSFFGLVGPAGMPPDTVKRLSDLISKVSAMPDVVARVRGSMFAEPAAGSPEEFRAFIEQEYDKWTAIGRVVTLSN